MSDGLCLTLASQANRFELFPVLSSPEACPYTWCPNPPLTPTYLVGQQCSEEQLLTQEMSQWSSSLLPHKATVPSPTHPSEPRLRAQPILIRPFV